MHEMTEYDEFVKRLSDAYPKAFRNVYCGISIGAGWYTIIEAVVANAKSHIKWKREIRANDLRRNRAVERGRDAVIKFVTRGKPLTAWDEQRVDEILEEGLIEPKRKVNHIEVHQIKEKFGGLRFYYEGGDDYVQGLVAMAESWAARTCETCDERGERRHGGWIRTLCDKHEAEHQQPPRIRHQRVGGHLHVAQAESPIAEDRRGERSREHEQAHRRRRGEQHRQPQRPVEGARETVHRLLRMVRRQPGQDHRGERDAEYAERKFHQPIGEVEPGDAARHQE